MKRLGPGSVWLGVRIAALVAWLAGPAPAHAQSTDDAGAPADAAPDPAAPAAADSDAAPAADPPASTEGTPPAASQEREAEIPPLNAEQQRMLTVSEGEMPGNGAPPPAPGSVRRFILPPFGWERGPNHETTAFIPLFFHHRTPDSRRLLVPLYFHLRSPRLQADVVFPFVWSYRGIGEDGSRYTTTVVPPVWVHRSVGEGRALHLDYGVLPLFGYDGRWDREGRPLSQTLAIPALLTFHHWTPDTQTTVVGPVIYVRNRNTRDLEVLPLYFSRSTPEVTWRFILPTLTYQRIEHDTGRVLTVVGPVWTDQRPDSLAVNVAPLVFHYHDRDSQRTTVVPLFHYESGPERFTLITPIFGYARYHNDRTLILPFFQHHRGETEWDSVAPLFFWVRTPRLGRSTVVTPLAWSSTAPIGFNYGIVPFFMRWHEYGRFDTLASPLFVHTRNFETRVTTTWVFPTVHTETAPDYSFFNVYPLFFSARGRDYWHTVFAPFVWDIGRSDTGTRTTVVAPFYARVARRDGYTQWIFPSVFTWEYGRGESRQYGFDFSPFVQYGQPRPGDHYWSVFYGLVGFRRYGGYEQVRLLWIPFTTRRPPGVDVPGSGRLESRGGHAGDVLFRM